MNGQSAKRAAGGLFRAGQVAALAALLAGCAGPRSDDGGLRDQSARVSSQVNVTTDRLAGNWHVRVGWPGTPELSGPLHLAQDEGTLTLKATATQGTARATLVPLGQGRFRSTQTDAFSESPLWVFWMDADDRTAAIGTPDGRFGWIMDRAPTGGADRITAAKEIMEWMGYDLSRSKETSE